MKKLICVLTVVLAAVCLMTACNFYTNTSNNTGLAKMSNQAEVEDMISYLSDNELEKAEALMHPGKEGTSGLDQISTYFNGRKVSKLATESVNVRNTKNTRGSTVQENASFKATLDDGEVVYLAVVYLQDNAGEGFVSFQLVLGAI